MSNTITTGYKATNAAMMCRGHQFELGKWYSVEGELEVCGNGFHFCEHPSGPWGHYPSLGTRIFKCEAKDVLETPFEAGADHKLVARHIRLVEEITVDSNGNDGDYNTGYGNTGNSNTGNRNTGSGNTGDQNTGYRNTGFNNAGHSNTGSGNTGYDNTGNHNNGNRNNGNRNTGDGNSGYVNTGDSNTGNSNTGDRNTGDGNTGDCNTGNSNTGDNNTGCSNTGNGNTGHGNKGYSNTGYRNIGHRNAGSINIGDYNTGERNIGDYNTGDGNAVSYSSGFFCQKEPTVISFDVDTGLLQHEFADRFYILIDSLSTDLMRDDEIKFSDYESLPGITPEKLKSLHQKFISARRDARQLGG